MSSFKKFSSLLLLIVLVYSHITKADTLPSAKPQVKMPEFAGGTDKIKKILSKNMKYPPSALQDKIEGTVYIQFAIDSNGTLSAPEVIQGVSPDLDQEALRLVVLLEHWIPGSINGQNKSFRMRLPIAFHLPKQLKKQSGKFPGDHSSHNKADKNMVNPEVNRNNYYSYYSNHAIQGGRIRCKEILSIAKEELDNQSYDIETEYPYKLSEDIEMVLSLYLPKQDIGIVCNQGHHAKVSEEHRTIRIYREKNFKRSEWILHDNLPENIIILQETWYWYQQDPVIQTIKVNEATIREIIRQDVREFTAEIIQKQ